MPLLHEAQDRYVQGYVRALAINFSVALFSRTFMYIPNIRIMKPFT